MKKAKRMEAYNPVYDLSTQRFSHFKRYLFSTFTYFCTNSRIRCPRQQPTLQSAAVAIPWRHMASDTPPSPDVASPPRSRASKHLAGTQRNTVEKTIEQPESVPLPHRKGWDNKSPQKCSWTVDIGPEPLAFDCEADEEANHDFSLQESPPGSSDKDHAGGKTQGVSRQRCDGRAALDANVCSQHKGISTG